MVLAGRDRERPGSAELSKFQIAHNCPLQGVSQKRVILHAKVF